jgi:hypothetical protein
MSYGHDLLVFRNRQGTAGHRVLRQCVKERDPHQEIPLVTGLVSA